VVSCLDDCVIKEGWFLIDGIRCLVNTSKNERMGDGWLILCVS
jgi:hypothetical protein